MSKIIDDINKARMTRKVPDFRPGDTVVVQVKVVEGDRERVQAYEGVVIARSNRGLNSSFTVRKISHGEGVERAREETRGDMHAETLLWDLTDSIHTAATDKRIQAIALDLEKFEGATQVTLEELAGALREFRASGKRVIAYGSEFGKERYYLAAKADELYLDPMALRHIA